MDNNGKSKKGRKPLVDPSIIFDILEKKKNDLFNKNGILNPGSSKIWKEIATSLEGRLTPASLHLAVYHNRNNWYNKLKDLLGFNEKKIVSSSDEEESSGESSTSTSVSSSSFSKTGKKIFNFSLAYDKYRIICPKTVTYKRGTKRRNYNALTPHVWTDIINDAFLEMHKLPCNLIYKRGKAYLDLTNSKYFITFNATCKDCNAKFFGWSNSKPDEGKPLNISVLTKDTKKLGNQHVTKRPLKGEKRKAVGKSLETDLACNWRRSNVVNMEFGNISPPNIYSTNVLRKAKQESRDKLIGIGNKCPVLSLIEFKNNSKYSGSIHNIGSDPFLVHYWSHHQVIIYKEANKKYCKLSIDATGGLVKKLKRSSLGLLSSHIFLYEAVVSTSFGHLTVTQMLSEKQNTLTIFLWLGEWMQSAGVHCPNEVVCDYSKAILGAVSRAFCDGNSLSSYIENCFMVLNGNKDSLPCCYIRIDVAHVIKIFCRIKCLNGIKNKTLKEFYVRALRILLLSESLIEFSDNLESLLTVMLGETDGWTENDHAIKTQSEKKREILLNKMKGLPAENDHTDNLQSIDNERDVEDIEEESLTANHALYQYLNNIQKRSKHNVLIKGNRLSAYYLPELAKHVLRICKDFPLWTNVMKTFFNSPYNNASSAVVENEFKELKNHILRFNVCPMTVDRFVITHLKNIESNAKLFRSSQLRNLSSKYNSDYKDHPFTIDLVSYKESKEAKDESTILEKYDLINSKSDKTSTNSYAIIESPFNVLITNNNNIDNSLSSNSSLDAIENWGGHGNDFLTIKMPKTTCKKRRMTKYMEPHPEIERILNTPLTRSTLDNLLINGNLTTPVHIGKSKYLVQNTCPFDSVASIIVMAYTDNITYKGFIDASYNNFLTFCKELAHHRTSKKTYVDRLHILKGIFLEDTSVTNAKLINSECNVAFIITKLLKDEPSAKEHISCSNNQCVNKSKTINCPTIITRLKEKKFSSLQNSLVLYEDNKTYDCPEETCNGVIKSFRTLQNHIFIETDVLVGDSHYKLDDFPVNLKLKTESFIFYGAVAYNTGHYVAYIRRNENNWELHNDILKKIIKFSSYKEKQIIPHLLVYIKI